MTTVELRYGAVFGKGDCSDWFEWEIELDGEEEAAYLRAKRLRLNLNECPELEGVLASAYEEIKEEETRNMIDAGDEYAIECTGQAEMDPDELNDLVADRDPHALEFFGLTEADEDELEEWDAHDLDELPLRCDFEEGFEPYSPFDEGWELIVQFAEADEFDDDSLMNAELSEEEAHETLTWLFSEAKGDYSVIKGYISRCSDIAADGLDLETLAAEIAHSLGLNDYISSDSDE